jgi:hypothetical protein
MSCNCNNKPCGCQDTKLTTPLTTFCKNQEPCEEAVFTECVEYNGNNIVDIQIKKGERLDETLKKFVLYLTNPTCFDPTATCQSIKNFEVLGITSTVGTVFWVVPGAPAAITAVTLQYSTDETFATSITADVTGMTQYKIINMIANTEYYIRLKTSTAGSPDCCTSITLNFKTLA